MGVCVCVCVCVCGAILNVLLYAVNGGFPLEGECCPCDVDMPASRLLHSPELMFYCI